MEKGTFEIHLGWPFGFRPSVGIACWRILKLRSTEPVLNRKSSRAPVSGFRDWEPYEVGVECLCLGVSRLSHRPSSSEKRLLIRLQHRKDRDVGSDQSLELYANPVLLRRLRFQSFPIQTCISMCMIHDLFLSSFSLSLINDTTLCSWSVRLRQFWSWDLTTGT